MNNNIAEELRSSDGICCEMSCKGAARMAKFSGARVEQSEAMLGTEWRSDGGARQGKVLMSTAMARQGQAGRGKGKEKRRTVLKQKNIKKKRRKGLWN